MRIVFSTLVLGVLLWSGTVAAQSGSAPADAPPDPDVTQQQRICDQEIDEVEATVAEHKASFDEMEQVRLTTLLQEAQNFCDDGNEVMAAIRLEAAAALVEITRPVD